MNLDEGITFLIFVDPKESAFHSVPTFGKALVKSIAVVLINAWGRGGEIGNTNILNRLDFTLLLVG